MSHKFAQDSKLVALTMFLMRLMPTMWKRLSSMQERKPTSERCFKPLRPRRRVCNLLVANSMAGRMELSLACLRTKRCTVLHEDAFRANERAKTLKLYSPCISVAYVRWPNDFHLSTKPSIQFQEGDLTIRTSKHPQPPPQVLYHSHSTPLKPP